MWISRPLVLGLLGTLLWAAPGESGLWDKVKSKFQDPSPASRPAPARPAGSSGPYGQIAELFDQGELVPESEFKTPRAILGRFSWSELPARPFWSALLIQPGKRPRIGLYHLRKFPHERPQCWSKTYHRKAFEQDLFTKDKYETKSFGLEKSGVFAKGIYRPLRPKRPGTFEAELRRNGSYWIVRVTYRMGPRKERFVDFGYYFDPIANCPEGDAP